MTGEAFRTWNTGAKRGYAAKACLPGVNTCLNIPAIRAVEALGGFESGYRKERGRKRKRLRKHGSGLPRSRKDTYIDQLISMTLATSLWHSAHWPTSSKSPPLTVPEKFVIVTSCLHLPHQTLRL